MPSPTLKAYDYHPIFNSTGFFVNTPMINRLNLTLNTWLRSSATGGVMVGGYRRGKTVAARAVSKNLINPCGEKVSAHRFTVPRRQTDVIPGLFKNICFSMKLKPKPRATGDDMANMIVHYLSEMAIENQTQQVVLFIDEFDRLSITQIEALCGFTDELSEDDINLCIFFVGNRSASQTLLKRINTEKRLELIRGRFFVHATPFQGLKSLADVTAILKEYDERRYPLETGPTYTEHFLKKKNKPCPKFADLATNIWNVYTREFADDLNLKSWPMQYFSTMARTLLVDTLPNMAAGDDLNDAVRQAIETSGLVPGLTEVLDA